MEIIIHQITCGEDEKGGYGLLYSSLSDLRLAKRLAFNTDIQEQTGGYKWNSAIRGFIVDDYYLIMKTFPDKSSDVRPGRVFSHVLIIPKIDLVNIQDISSMLELIPDRINKEVISEPILYNHESDFVFDIPLSFQRRFNKAIHGYVHNQDYSKTIIWVGEEDFDLALALFWKVLPIEEKEILYFGLSFNSDAIPKGKLNFINIPENIESKFLKKGFCLVRKNESYVLTEIFEQLLAGDLKANERINKFTKTIETSDLSRDAINNIGKVLNTFESLDLISDLKKLNTLSHVVAEYSPLREKGRVFKEKLLDKICVLVSVCDVSELHLIKTFKLNSFENSESKLSQSLNKWLSNQLFSEKETRKNNYSPLFEKLNGNTINNWWTVNINHQLYVFLSSVDRIKASIVLNWIKQDISVLDFIEPLVDKSIESEDSFTSQISKSFYQSCFQNLVSFALKRNWLKFHAKLMILEYSFEKALSKQLAVDKNEEYFDGINEIITNISPTSVISFAIINGDKRLIEICGKYCRDDSSLLQNIDVTNINWQAIWYNSIINGNNMFEGIANPSETVFTILNSINDSRNYDTNLLVKISVTEFGNILDYKNRDEIWKFLPTSVRRDFLTKTSTALLQRISIDTSTVIPDDKELSDFIISNGISDFLYFNRDNFKVTLPIFITFKQLPENILKDYVGNYSGNIDIVAATQLGTLVLQRNYRSVAHVIYQKSYSNTSFRISLRECHGLLGILDRGFAWANGLISNVEITENEWWGAFTSLCIRLYPGGPNESKIWERAHGDESDLILKSTGKETWNAILKKLRFGGCDEVTPKKLIKKMLDDYKKNEELKTLKELLEKI